MEQQPETKKGSNWGTRSQWDTGHDPIDPQESNCPACFHSARFNFGTRSPLAETDRLDRARLEEFLQLVQSQRPGPSECLLKPV
jgi:hypothetical protein